MANVLDNKDVFVHFKNSNNINKDDMNDKALVDVLSQLIDHGHRKGLIADDINDDISIALRKADKSKMVTDPNDYGYSDDRKDNYDLIWNDSQLKSLITDLNVPSNVLEYCKNIDDDKDDEKPRLTELRLEDNKDINTINSFLDFFETHELNCY